MCLQCKMHTRRFSILCIHCVAPSSAAHLFFYHYYCYLRLRSFDFLLFAGSISEHWAHLLQNFHLHYFFPLNMFRVCRFEAFGSCALICCQMIVSCRHACEPCPVSRLCLGVFVCLQCIPLLLHLATRMHTCFVCAHADLRRIWSRRLPSWKKTVQKVIRKSGRNAHGPGLCLRCVALLLACGLPRFHALALV